MDAPLDPPLRDWEARARALGWEDDEVAELRGWTRPWRYVAAVRADAYDLVTTIACEPNPGQAMTWATRATYARAGCTPVAVHAAAPADRLRDVPDLALAPEPNLEVSYEYCACGPTHDAACELYEPPPRTWRERRAHETASHRAAAVRAVARAAREAQATLFDERARAAFAAKAARLAAKQKRDATVATRRAAQLAIVR